MKRCSDQEIESMLRGDEPAEPPPELLDLLRAEIPQQLGGDAGDDSADDAAVEAPPPEPSNVVAFPRRRWLLAAASVLFAAGASILTFRLVAPQESLSGVAEHDVAAQAEGVEAEGVEALPEEPAEQARQVEERVRSRVGARLIEGEEQKKVQKASRADGESDVAGGPRAQGAPASQAASGDVAARSDAPADAEPSTAESSSAPDAAFADAADDSPSALGVVEEPALEQEAASESAERFASEGLVRHDAAPSSESRPAPPEDRDAYDDSAAELRKDAEQDESSTAGLAKKERARSAAPSPGRVDSRRVDSRRVAELREKVGEAREVSVDRASLWRPGSPWGDALAAVEHGRAFELDAERLETLRAALAEHPALEEAGERLLELWPMGIAERRRGLAELASELRRLERAGVADAAQMRRLAELLGSGQSSD